MSTPPIDPKQRFSDRVDDYVRYRPGYPPGIVDFLAKLGVLGPGRVVADVGSGTGIFTRLLLVAGARVLAVEPNAAMRAACEKALAGTPRFESLDGSSEVTGLQAHSVDLVTAAQAFPLVQARSHARRVHPYPPAGRVGGPRVESAQSVPIQRRLRGYARAPRARIRERARKRSRRGAAHSRIRAFFAPGAVCVATLSNEQILDEAAARGRLLSSSYCPRPGDPLFEPMMMELARIFRLHSSGGQVALSHDTLVWYGRLS